jgi:flagellar hook-length control protein FliK
MTPERAAATDAARTQSPPGRPPARGKPEGGGDPFGTLLDHHQARTADAEGHKPVRDAGERPAKHKEHKAAQSSDKGSQLSVLSSQNAPEAPAAPAPVQVVEGPGAPEQAVAAPVLTAPAVTVAALASSATPVVTEAPAQQQNVDPAQVAAVAVTTTSADVAPKAAASQTEVEQTAVNAAEPQIADATAKPVDAEPTDAKPVDVKPTDAKPAAPQQAQPEVDAKPADNKPVSTQQPTVKTDDAPKPQAPNAAPSKPAEVQVPTPHEAAPTPPAPQAPPAPTGQPVNASQAPVASTQAPVTSNQAPVAPQAQVPTQPVTEAPTVAPTQPQPGMRLHQAVETVHAVIRMAQQNGITQARVQLHPEELGSIDIHLRSTSEGLVARVMADASQAANVLRHAGDELKRMLEGQGLNLARLDVGTAPQDQRRSGFGPGDQPGGRRNGQGAPNGIELDGSVDTTTEETTIRLPNGVLVDVLA